MLSNEVCTYKFKIRGQILHKMICSEQDRLPQKTYPSCVMSSLVNVTLIPNFHVFVQKSVRLEKPIVPATMPDGD